MYEAIKKHTTPAERAEIARIHGVKSRAGLSQILSGKRQNKALVDALLDRAEKNKAADLERQQRAKALAND